MKLWWNLPVVVVVVVVAKEKSCLTMLKRIFVTSQNRCIFLNRLCQVCKSVFFYQLEDLITDPPQKN